jgi:hypothetical protein
MQIFNEKKLISTSNEEEYRFVVVTNEKKVFILSYKHIKRNWATI